MSKYVRDDAAFRTRMSSLADELRRVSHAETEPTHAFADRFAESVHDVAHSRTLRWMTLGVLVAVLLFTVRAVFEVAAMVTVIVVPVALVAFAVRALIPRSQIQS